MVEISRYLRWYDYVVFGSVLAISAAIGIVFAIRARRNSSPEEYLLASKQLSVAPVALSLLASFMSAVTLLGTPSEIYVYGTQYVWIGVSYFFVILFSNEVTLPVFHRMQVQTSYQYLKLRFHKANQIGGAISFNVQMILYMGVVIYAPSLALSAVTGFNVWAAVVSIGLVATFYTTIGGIKAVVWTDVFQICMMFAGLLVALIKGLIQFGGFTKIWQDLEADGRIEFFNFSADPTVRHTFWTQWFGNIFVWWSIYGINQTMVQRCLSLNSMREIRIAYWINFPGLVLLMLICSVCGGVIYSAYRGCDPINMGEISAGDQLLPLYVMDYISNIPILPGIFVASVFSGALSTVSSGVNSLASVTLHDVLDTCVVNLTEAKKTILCKVMALVYGLLSLLFAVVASQLGPVLQAALGIFGMVGGPMLGVFTLGMVFPFATWQGALAGHIGAQIFVFWMGLGYYVVGVKVPKLPRYTYNCSTEMANTTTTALLSSLSTTTATEAATTIDPQSQISPFYKVSYVWYAFYGWLAVILIGLIASLITRDREAERTRSRNLFTPLVRRFMEPRPGDDDDQPKPYIDPKDVKMEYEFPMEGGQQATEKKELEVPPNYNTNL